MIIDFGTVITRLPPAAYEALKSTFVKEMKSYKNAPGVSILDTCFDFSNTTEDKIKLPRIGFEFSGNVSVDLPASGILYVIESNLSKVCLAFAAVSPTPENIHLLLQFDGKWDGNGVFSYTYGYEIDIPIQAPYKDLACWR
ncbi:unnamed protein product [Cuscuta campestris]|uniref:Peptidase A1 domain-containing protein n=1 Tax=Cuscuta campestris TaxID=132261 RepID=A0A484NFL5_9ASTE|nr:unnamed protein product [Cuscuta campestris]